MDMQEKISSIRALLDLNEKMIIEKIEGNDNNLNELIQKAKKIAKSLENDGIGTFNYETNQDFMDSLNSFLSEF